RLTFGELGRQLGERRSVHDGALGGQIPSGDTALLGDTNAGHAAIPMEYEGYAHDGRAVGTYVGGLPVLRDTGAQEVGIGAELIAEGGIVADADTAASGEREVGRAHTGARGAIQLVRQVLLRGAPLIGRRHGGRW